MVRNFDVSPLEIEVLRCMIRSSEGSVSYHIYKWKSKTFHLWYSLAWTGWPCHIRRIRSVLRCESHKYHFGKTISSWKLRFFFLECSVARFIIALFLSMWFITAWIYLHLTMWSYFQNPRKYLCLENFVSLS